MPWTTADVDKFIKGLDANGKKVWVETANSTLEVCKKKGGTDASCSPRAIRIANKVAGKYRESIGHQHPELYRISREIKEREAKAMKRMIERTLQAVLNLGENIGLLEVGRTISAKNEGKLRAAAAQIQEILKVLDAGITEAQRASLGEINELIEQELSFDEIRSQVRAALIVKLSAKTIYIRDIYPSSVIYEGVDGFGNYTGKLYMCDYEIDEAGVVTLQDPVEVAPQMTYNPVEALKETKKTKPLADDCLDFLSDAPTESGEYDFVSLIESKPVNGRLPIKIIGPGWGASGFYSPEVLAAAAGLYAPGTHMYWNHPTKSEESDRPERSLNDLAAVITEPAKYDPAGPFGPGLYSAAKTFSGYEKAITEMAPHIGLSHRAAGKAKKGEAEGKQGIIVENINKVQSVDFVTKAGAKGQIVQLFEAAGRNATDATLSEKERKAKEVKDMEAAQQLQEANTQIATLKQEKVVRECKDLVTKQVGAAELPEVSKTRLIATLTASPVLTEAKELDVTATEKGITEAIKVEKDYIQTLAGKKGVHGLGEGAGDPLNESVENTEKTHKALVESFKEGFLAQGKSEQESTRLAEIAAKGR